MKQQEIWVKSSLDGTMQPSLFYKSECKQKRPLLVGLHTWSYGRFNQIDNMLPMAERYDFNLLLPEFRGPNLSSNPDYPKACGSEFARQDIVDAIDYLIAKENVDENNIFLLGASGGGHMALLMAGMCPERFKAIGAFVPITDLTKWEKQNDYYSSHIKACCGEEMPARSPMTYIDTIAKANVKIFHGKHDHVVPVSHSLELFNGIVEKHPKATVYLDIFDGSHQIDMELAQYWILSQYNGGENVQVTG